MTTTVQQDEYTLPQLYHRGKRLVLIAEEDGKPELYMEAKLLLSRAAISVAQLRIFSKNEELDDIKTSSLKYLLCPYYLAQCEYNNRGSPMDRPTHLNRANAYLNTFLMKCDKYNIMHEKDQEAFQRERVLSRTDHRDELRSQHQREKKLEQSLKQIEKQKGIKLNKQLDEEEDITSWSNWDEEEERTYYLALLQACCIKSLRDVAMIETELPFAKRMAEEMEKNGGKLKKREDDRVKIDITKRLEQSRVKREQLKKQVFQPGWTLPTMSVEEAGYWEMQHMLKQQGKGESTQPKPEGTESEEEEEEDIYKQREWDAFKDDNPAGWGNRYNQG